MPHAADVATVADLLRAVLAKTGEIVIRPMPTEYAGEFLGLSVFSERSVYIADRDDAADWLRTFVHELHHHLLGPVDSRFAAVAEQRVQDATAQTLAAAGAAR